MFRKIEVVAVLVTFIFILQIQKSFTVGPPPSKIPALKGPGIQFLCNDGKVNELIEKWMWWYSQKKDHLYMAGHDNFDNNNSTTYEWNEYQKLVEKDIHFLKHLPIKEIRETLIESHKYTGQANDNNIGVSDIAPHKVNSRNIDTNAEIMVETYAQASRLNLGSNIVGFIPLPSEAYFPGKAVVTAYSNSTGNTKDFFVHCLVAGFDLSPESEDISNL